MVLTVISKMEITESDDLSDVRRLWNLEWRSVSYLTQTRFCAPFRFLHVELVGNPDKFNNKKALGCSHFRGLSVAASVITTVAASTRLLGCWVVGYIVARPP